MNETYSDDYAQIVKLVENIKSPAVSELSVNGILEELLTGEWNHIDNAIDLLLDVLKDPGTPKYTFLAIIRKLHHLQTSEMAEDLEIHRDNFTRELEEIVSGYVSSSELLSELSKSDELGGYFARAIAENPDATEATLRRLTKCDLTGWDMDDVYDAIALNDNAPVDILVECALGYHGKYAHENAFENDNLTGEVLHDLAITTEYDEFYDVVHGFIPLSNNARTETLTLLYEKYYKDRFDDNAVTAKWAIARHDNTDIKILEKLCNDPSESVRRGVAENVRTPEHIMLKLAEDDGETVKERLFKNPSVTKKVLRKLFEASEEFRKNDH